MYINKMEGKMKKLLVWDLDGTIWDGVFLYVGNEVKLKPKIGDVIKELDSRGIIQSINSRNPKEVLEVIKENGLMDYFVFPKTGWQRKHLMMADLLQNVHILPEHTVFIDNEQYERELMHKAFPELLTIDAERYMDLLIMEDFKGDSKGSKRREFFKEDEKRSRVQTTMLEDKFFESLDISMSLKKIQEEDELEDIMRLINRANQLHATGNKFDSFEDFKVMYNDCDVIAAYPKDRFGDYGLALTSITKVIDGVVNIKELVVSCRIIDREMLPSYLLSLQNMYNNQKMYIQYKKTKYNGFLLEQIRNTGFDSEKLLIDKLIEPKVKCRIEND